MKKRQDVVNDGEIAVARSLANAPASEDDYFMVPKVIE
jgi:aspartyl-tRNA(Asn)/glutamyl-tRNA(Gln) amidotransferase subunit C